MLCKSNGETDNKKDIFTIKRLLQIALEPVGNTMYVWGGGWNEEDTGAGDDARRIGISPKWKWFADRQRSDYDYKTDGDSRQLGLDCSGYIGWCVYNLLERENGHRGYVYPSGEMAKQYEGEGLGDFFEISDVKDYQAGDIMSSACCRHVWMVVGPCEDGSVVLLHATPPGVQLQGTVTPEGQVDSEAHRLAQYYMKKYYPEWNRRFPGMAKDKTYLTCYAQFRWREPQIIQDTEKYRKKTAEQILMDLFD